jgi:hypothetical protein
MFASSLRAEQFNRYPPQAKRLAVAHIELLRHLPTIFVATLLRELIGYDWRFPAERDLIDWQLSYLGSLSQEQLRLLFAKFARIKLDPKLDHVDWVKEPALFSERLTTYLWSTHQIDAFRAAATEYMSKLRQASSAESPQVPRLGIAVIGKGVEKSEFILFRKLRPQGVFFSQVSPENGLQTLVDEVSARAAAHSMPYRHWYIEGGTAVVAGPHVTSIAYDALQPIRTALLHKMQQIVQSGTGGPELMETTLAKLSPGDLGMSGVAENGVLENFQVKVLTEGSGTQIFSTTFVQWAARESLRRAQPFTLLARFVPRQRQRQMNELLEGQSVGVELDPCGSLVDADMGAYYIWLDQQRLANAAQSSFLVWFEDHREALAIAPGLPRGTQSDRPADLKQILRWMA